MSLPVELVDKLKRAAEYYSVTQIEGLLTEMAELGDDAARLAAHLRELRQAHDMEGIVEVLEGVEGA